MIRVIIAHEAPTALHIWGLSIYRLADQHFIAVDSCKILTELPEVLRLASR
jgi:hypothetical protein